MEYANGTKPNPGQIPADEETIDLRRIFNYFLGNLHWFILSVFLALVVAFLFNRYTTKIYNISTTVLIEDDKKNSPWLSSTGPGMDITQGFGLFPSLQNFENQTIIIKSYSQVRRTIEKLNFEVSYFGQGRVVSREIYKQAPFEVIFSKNKPQPQNLEFDISIDKDGSINIKAEAERLNLYTYTDDEFSVWSEPVNLSRKLKPGEWLSTPWCNFQIKINEQFNPDLDNNYYFHFNSYHHLTLAYQSKINIEPMSKGSSMVQLSLQEANPQKGIDFLGQLTEEYLMRNLEKKNEFAMKTIEFIDSQLDTISESLNKAELALEEFRSVNKVMDLSFQAQKVFEQVQDLENQKMQLEVQSNYYTYLLRYIEENQDIESVMAPSVMGIQDPLLNQLILEINQLSIEKSSLINVKKGTDFTPIQTLDAKIKNAKKSIYENAVNLLENNKLSLKDIKRRLELLAVDVNNLPETERKLFGIERRFKLNDNLYTFLLQRRSEAQIAKASNTADNEVIDRAMVTNNGYPIKPKSRINFIIAFLLGFAIPGVIIALKEYFNMKVDSPDVVKKMTDRPIIGYIPNSGESAENNIFQDLDSPWAEAFRIIRTKMQFITREIKSPVILVTSSIPGEGKSFVAINMASAYSLTGKKTMLVGFDLRRPQVAQRFNLDKNIGVTSFLIGEASVDEIIQKTENPNLDLIASGVIPPNPAELISDSKTVLFLEQLKERYDYIILDTAPMSPVSDTHHLVRLVDASLFVVRDRYTHKQILAASLEEAENNHIQNLSILMNDIQMKRKRYGYKYGYSYGYRYGYKYGYGYGYGYYNEKGKKKGKKKKS